ncbi:MAG: hypothetical protein LBK13_04130 [Spirochaetales bacterium]|jgi:hypothetical protein|nr:hypothetical protein [Spirochaetales bacterium]
MVVSDRYMDCIAGLIPASSNNAAELRTAPSGGVLNPLAGIKIMSKNYNGALLLYSIFSTEGDNGSELKNIIAHIDYINHAVITFKEFTDGINYLLRNGLVEEKNKKYFTDKRYKEWYENEYKNRKRIYFAKVVEQTSKYLNTALRNNNIENIRTEINETYFENSIKEYIK